MSDLTHLSYGTAYQIKTLFVHPSAYILQESCMLAVDSSAGMRSACLPAGLNERFVDFCHGLGSRLYILGTKLLYAYECESGDLRALQIERPEGFEAIQVSFSGRYLSLLSVTGSSYMYRLHDGQFLPVDRVALATAPESCACSTLKLFTFIGETYAFSIHSGSEGCTLKIWGISDDGATAVDTLFIPETAFPEHVLDLVRGNSMHWVLIEGPRAVQVVWTSQNHFTRSVYSFKEGRYESFQSCCVGSLYNVDGSDCPSFFIFASGRDAVLGIVLEDRLRFWNVDCDVAGVTAAVHMETFGTLYLSSIDEAAFVNIETKALRLSKYLSLQSFGPFERWQVSSLLPGCGPSSIVCLSASKDQIYGLASGIPAQLKLTSEPLFRGYTDAWTVRKHALDIVHAYLVLSSAFSSGIFAIEAGSLTEVSAIFNFESHRQTLCAFNLPSSGLFVQVHTAGIRVTDLTRVESAHGDSVRYTQQNDDNDWTLAAQDDTYLVVYAAGSNQAWLYGMSNRPRQTEFLKKLADLDLKEAVGGAEVSCIAIAVDADKIVLAIGHGAPGVLLATMDRSGAMRGVQVVLLEETPHSLSLKLGPSPRLLAGTRVGSVFSVELESLTVARLSIAFNGPVQLRWSSSGDVLAAAGDQAFMLSGSKVLAIHNWKIERGAAWVSPKVGDNCFIGLAGDCLHVHSLPPHSTGQLSKRPFITGKGISDFTVLEDECWLCGTNQAGKNGSIQLYSKFGALKLAVNLDQKDILMIARVPSSRSKVISASMADLGTHTVLELIEVSEDRIEAFPLCFVNGRVSKIVIQEPLLVCCAGEDLEILDLGEKFTSVVQKRSYRFRNTILDMAFWKDRLAVSLNSDGLDVFSVEWTTGGGIALNELSGDRCSRSCVSCVWIDDQTILSVDRNRRVFLSRVRSSSRWLKTEVLLQLPEIPIAVFEYSGRFLASTQSGSVFDLSGAVKRALK